MSQENVEVVRSAWHAWTQGDFDALFESVIRLVRLENLDAPPEAAEGERPIS